MKCKNKHLSVNGLIQSGNQIKKDSIIAIVTNDEVGKTLTLAYGYIGLTVPFEVIEEYLK